MHNVESAGTDPNAGTETPKLTRTRPYACLRRLHYSFSQAASAGADSKTAEEINQNARDNARKRNGGSGALDNGRGITRDRNTGHVRLRQRKVGEDSGEAGDENDAAAGPESPARAKALAKRSRRNKRTLTESSGLRLRQSARRLDSLDLAGAGGGGSSAVWKFGARVSATEARQKFRHKLSDEQRLSLGASLLHNFQNLPSSL